MLSRQARNYGLGAMMLLTLTNVACATMGTETIMARVDTNKDNRLSWSEVRTAAGNRYDLIQSKNGGRVTMLQLGGRFVPSDLKQVGRQSPDIKSSVSKAEYLALAEIFFDKADAKRKSGDAPGSGTIDIGELSSVDGKKLIGSSNNDRKESIGSEGPTSAARFRQSHRVALLSHAIAQSPMVWRALSDIISLFEGRGNRSCAE